MVVRPSTSALTWCQKEVGPILEGLQILFRSQLGYEGRRLEANCAKQCLKTVVMGGTIVDPTKPTKQPSLEKLLNFSTSSTEVLERAQVVAAGIRTFAGLLSQGYYPGSGGYTLSPLGEKIYGAKNRFPVSQDIISNLSKVADLIGRGSFLLPNIDLSNLLSLGSITSEVDASKHKTSKQYGKPSNHNISTEVILSTGLTPEEEEFLLKAARSVDDIEAEEKIRGKKTSSNDIYRPSLPQDFSIKTDDKSDILTKSKESRVPASRIGRLASFGHLALGLAGGAAAEMTRRTLGFRQNSLLSGQSDNPFLSPANADRIVQTLCRVRGAALKLGQMLSIQDQETVPAALLEVFERVRHSADFMPLRQVQKQMSETFGSNWRDQFISFEDHPFAAASIGQVHEAVLKDGKKVAVKVQYPGVAEGIDSDIDNLVSVLSVGGLFPKGMFLDSFVKVARRELGQECDYEREARAIRKFRDLLSNSKDYFVPEVIDHLSSKRVLTTEFVYGKPVDRCVNEPQVVRDYIAGKFIELCLKEIFEWRFMQTDPNWSNFYLGVHPVSGEPRMVLLDFGASRSYPKKFVDKYMKIIKAASEGDTKKIIEFSRDIGFLTGYESEIMQKAHTESVLIMGETLASTKPYDFSLQNVTKRIHELVPVMLEHRLTSPPEEIYSLHRKLSGAYLLATKLKATVSCGGLFDEIYSKYSFGNDNSDIDIDNVVSQ